MLRQFLVGGIISLGNIAVHAAVMALVVDVVRRVGRWEHRQSSLWLAAIMVATVAVLLVAHVGEVIMVCDLFDRRCRFSRDRGPVLRLPSITRLWATATSCPSSTGA